MPGRPVPGDDVQRDRLRGRARRALAVERRRDPVPRGHRRRRDRLPRHALVVGQGGRGPRPRGARAGRHLRRRPRVEPVRAQRPHAGRPAPAVQARVAGRPARHGGGLAGRRPGGADRAGRRLEHRAGERRRLGHGGLRPLDARVAAGARRLPRHRRRRVRRRRPPVRARAGGLHLLGLHAAALPPARGHADRLRAGLPRPRGPRDRREDRPRGAQGQGRQRPRPGHRRPRRRTGAGWRPCPAVRRRESGRSG